MNSARSSRSWPRLVLTVAVLGSLWLQATKRDNERTFESISSTLFGLLYIWFLGGHLIWLRHLGSDGLLRGEGWVRSGVGLLAVCLVCCKFSDIAAFLVGRKYGRHKMIRRISPGKSFEAEVRGPSPSLVDLRRETSG